MALRARRVAKAPMKAGRVMNAFEGWKGVDDMLLFQWIVWCLLSNCCLW